MTVIDHMSFREEQYRLRLAALKEEADAAARDRRRTGAKLQRARAEVAPIADLGGGACTPVARNSWNRASPMVASQTTSACAPYGPALLTDP